jgi:hypothetical protein
VTRLLRAAWAALVEFRREWHDDRRFDPVALHPARVLRQSDDLLLVDVEAENPAVGFHDAVGIATGLPGLRVRLGVGSTVFLTWRSRWSRYPEVHVPPSTQQLSLVAAREIEITTAERVSSGGGPQ